MTAIPSLIVRDCADGKPASSSGLLIECHEDHIDIVPMMQLLGTRHRLSLDDWRALSAFVVAHIPAAPASAETGTATLLVGGSLGATGESSRLYHEDVPHLEDIRMAAPPHANGDGLPARDDPRVRGDLRPGPKPKWNEAAVIARMRELAGGDGYMPTRIAWDNGRGDGLPSYPVLVKKQRWSTWAKKAGLASGRSRPRGLGLRPPLHEDGADTITAPVPSPADASRKRPPAMKPRDGLLLAAKEVIRTIAIDGKMPSQRKFDLHKPEHLPLGGELLHRLDLPSWGQLAELCELDYEP